MREKAPVDERAELIKRINKVLEDMPLPVRVVEVLVAARNELEKERKA